MKRTIVASILAATMFSASAASINDLEPGMTLAQVKEMLGDPSDKQFVEGKYVLTYKQFKLWHGQVPYLLVFDKETGKLEQWGVDNVAEARSAEQMRALAGHLQRDQAIRALNAPRNDTVTIKVR